MTAKPILYGVSDFVLMRTKGAYYIDRTAYIRELEDSRYVMFLRPRRLSWRACEACPPCHCLPGRHPRPLRGGVAK